VSTVPAPASDAEAIKMVLTGLSHLAAADHTAMAAQAQAECLQALEQGDAISTAARAGFLAAFTAGRSYSADPVARAVGGDRDGLHLISTAPPS
jgi:hypothetical protein